jgi:hypothetical protein
LRGRIDVPTLKPLDAKAELSGVIDIARVRELLPPTAAVDVLRRLGLTGRVELTARATYAKADGLRIPELTARASDVVLPARQA